MGSMHCLVHDNECLFTSAFSGMQKIRNEFLVIWYEMVLQLQSLSSECFF